VQAAHAAIEAARHFLTQHDNHPHLVLLGVADETELRRAATLISSIGIRISPFYEDDMDGQLTAVASEPVSGTARRPFRRYRLLQGGTT
jgi:hypothetical protein